MGLHHSPRIVTSGLVLALDAADANSYVSGSSSWFDLSGGNNTGTLTNTPGYNSANGGSIVFDGVDDYGSINTPSNINLNNTISINLWVKFISFNPVNPRIIEIQDSSYSVQILIDGTTKFATKNSKWQPNFDNNYWSTPVINTWYNIVCIFTPTSTNFYQNGVELSSTTGSNVGIGNQSNKIILGVRSDFQSTTWLNSYLSNIKIYNRALSSTEVLQNYNATKSRFGLK